MGPMGGRGGRGGTGYGGGFPGMGMQRGGYGGMGGGKMPMGYDLYGPGGMFGSNAQALYSLAGMQQQFGGMQPPGGAGGSKGLNAFNANINLKALALASSLGGFPGDTGQSGEGGFSQEESRPYAGQSLLFSFPSPLLACMGVNAFSGVKPVCTSFSIIKLNALTHIMKPG